MTGRQEAGTDGPIGRARDLAAAGRLTEAIAAFGRILAAQPGRLDALTGLAEAAWTLGQMKLAADCLRLAIRAQGEDFTLHHNLGNVLRRQGDLAGAEAAYRRAIELRPAAAESYNGLGHVHLAWGRLEQALECYRRAQTIDPEQCETLNNLGNALRRLGRYEEAETHYRRALTLRPGHAGARYNLALLQLLGGDFTAGFAGYEERFHLGEEDPVFRSPADRGIARWRGETLPEGRLLVVAEQGLGDAIQFVRYLPAARARVGRLVFACGPALHRLFADLPGVDTLTERYPAAWGGMAVDRYVPLLSLPPIVSLPPAGLPVPPYLRADRDAQVRWRERLAPASLRVGLVWAGGEANPNDRFRSCRLDDFAPLGALPGVRWFSLQRGPAAGQAKTPPAGLELFDAAGELADLADTAALVAALDLVISVDTAVAHLAGALNRPVWTLLPFDPDWRWGLSRTDSPWYPSMRLFRQPRPGDWRTVIASVARELTALLTKEDSPQVLSVCSEIRGDRF